MLPTFSLECLIKCNHVSEKRTFINDFLKHYCSHFPNFSSAKRCICGFRALLTQLICRSLHLFQFSKFKLSLCSEKPVVCIKYIFFWSPPNLSKVIYAKFTLYLLEIAISEFSLPWISIFFPATSFLRTLNFQKL